MSLKMLYPQLPSPVWISSAPILRVRVVQIVQASVSQSPQSRALVQRGSTNQPPHDPTKMINGCTRSEEANISVPLRLVLAAKQ